MFATSAWFPSAVPRTRDRGNKLDSRTQAPTQGFRSPSTFNNQKVFFLSDLFRIRYLTAIL
jgi:hypothetical protein